MGLFCKYIGLFCGYMDGAVLWIYRALLQIHRALLWIHRALLQMYGILCGNLSHFKCLSQLGRGLCHVGIFCRYIGLFCGYVGLFCEYKSRFKCSSQLGRGLCHVTCTSAEEHRAHYCIGRALLWIHGAHLWICRRYVSRNTYLSKFGCSWLPGQKFQCTEFLEQNCCHTLKIACTTHFLVDSKSL